MPRSDRDKQPRPSEAHEHAYRPADGSDWTDPDPKTVGEALDAIAGAPPGAGDVVGPAGATNNAIARYDTATGKLIQDSAVTIDDTTGYMRWPLSAAALLANDTVCLVLWEDTGPDYVAVRNGPGAARVVAAGTTTDVNLQLEGKNSGIVTADNDGTDREVATISGTQTLTNKTLTTPTIASFTNATHDHEDAAGGGAALKPTTIGVGRNVIASGNGNKDIDWTDGNVQTFVISGGNVDFDFDVAPPLPATGATFVHLLVTQDSTPGRTVTFNDCSNWVRNETPVQSTGAADVDLYSFLYDGTTYYGIHHPNFG